MMRTATVTLVRDGTEAEATLASVAYELDEDNSSTPPVSVLRSTVALPSSGEKITIESACAEGTGNVSLSVHLGQTQLLLITCRWADIDPYVGVFLPGHGSWLSVYLQRK